MNKTVIYLVQIALFSLISWTAHSYRLDLKNKGEEAFEAQCNEADQTHIQKGNHAFAEAWANCSGISGLDINCFDDQYPNDMSEQCLSCFDEMTKCAASKCAFNCMFSPRGANCRQCTVDNCGQAMENCSGAKLEDLPDFESLAERYFFDELASKMLQELQIR